MPPCQPDRLWARGCRSPHSRPLILAPAAKMDGRSSSGRPLPASMAASEALCVQQTLWALRPGVFRTLTRKRYCWEGRTWTLPSGNTLVRLNWALQARCSRRGWAFGCHMFQGCQEGCQEWTGLSWCSLSCSRVLPRAPAAGETGLKSILGLSAGL